MQRLGVLLVVFFCACGDNAKLTGDAGTDGSTIACGNGVMDANEECDDGDANGSPGARCTTLCRWTCLDAGQCTDMDPCNGEETCSDAAIFGSSAAAGASA